MEDGIMVIPRSGNYLEDCEDDRQDSITERWDREGGDNVWCHDDDMGDRS